MNDEIIFECPQCQWESYDDNYVNCPHCRAHYGDLIKLKEIDLKCDLCNRLVCICDAQTDGDEST